MSANPLLMVHYGVGFLVFLTAIAAIFAPLGRRIVLYVLILQIVIGVALWLGGRVPPPSPWHWVPAILVGGLYAAATAAQRRGRSTLPYTIAGAIVLAGVFSVGMHAVKG